MLTDFAIRRQRVEKCNQTITAEWVDIFEYIDVGSIVDNSIYRHISLVLVNYLSVVSVSKYSCISLKRNRNRIGGNHIIIGILWYPFRCTAFTDFLSLSKQTFDGKTNVLNFPSWKPPPLHSFITLLSKLSHCDLTIEISAIWWIRREGFSSLCPCLYTPLEF